MVPFRMHFRRTTGPQAQLRPRGKFARAVGLEPVQREASRGWDSFDQLGPLLMNAGDEKLAYMGITAVKIPHQPSIWGLQP